MLVEWKMDSLMSVYRLVEGLPHAVVSEIREMFFVSKEWMMRNSRTWPDTSRPSSKITKLTVFRESKVLVPCEQKRVIFGDRGQKLIVPYFTFDYR